jgi:hypothetical protein
MVEKETLPHSLLIGRHLADYSGVFGVGTQLPKLMVDILARYLDPKSIDCDEKSYQSRHTVRTHY